MPQTVRCSLSYFTTSSETCTDYRDTDQPRQMQHSGPGLRPSDHVVVLWFIFYVVLLVDKTPNSLNTNCCYTDEREETLFLKHQNKHTPFWWACRCWSWCLCWRGCWETHQKRPWGGGCVCLLPPRRNTLHRQGQVGITNSFGFYSTWRPGTSAHVYELLSQGCKHKLFTPNLNGQCMKPNSAVLMNRHNITGTPEDHTDHCRCWSASVCVSGVVCDAHPSEK